MQLLLVYRETKLLYNTHTHTLVHAFPQSPTMMMMMMMMMMMSPAILVHWSAWAECVLHLSIRLSKPI
jgi:hypothetical protein